MSPATIPLSEATADLVAIVAFSAAGIAAAILIVGVLIVALLTDATHQLRRIGEQVERIREEGVDLQVEPGALGRPALDAEQVVRGAGFLITLLRGVVKKPGEAIPSADRLTLDLGKAMGVPLPVREEVTAFLPNGATVQSGLQPYGAAPITAVLDRKAV